MRLASQDRIVACQRLDQEKSLSLLRARLSPWPFVILKADGKAEPPMCSGPGHHCCLYTLCVYVCVCVWGPGLITTVVFTLCVCVWAWPDHHCCLYPVCVCVGGGASKTGPRKCRAFPFFVFLFILLSAFTTDLRPACWWCHCFFSPDNRVMICYRGIYQYDNSAHPSEAIRTCPCQASECAPVNAVSFSQENERSLSKPRC